MHQRLTQRFEKHAGTGIRQQQIACAFFALFGLFGANTRNSTVITLMEKTEYTLGARSADVLRFDSEEELALYKIQNPEQLDVGRILVPTHAPNQIARMIVTYPDVATKQAREMAMLYELAKAKANYAKAFTAGRKKVRAQQVQEVTQAAKEVKLAAAATEAEQAAKRLQDWKDMQLADRRKSWIFLNSPEGRAQAFKIRSKERRIRNAYEEDWEYMSPDQQKALETMLDGSEGPINTDPDPDLNPDREIQKATSSESDVL